MRILAASRKFGENLRSPALSMSLQNFYCVQICNRDRCVGLGDRYLVRGHVAVLRAGLGKSVSPTGGARRSYRRNGDCCTIRGSVRHSQLCGLAKDITECQISVYCFKWSV